MHIRRVTAVLIAALTVGVAALLGPRAAPADRSSVGLAAELSAGLGAGYSSGNWQADQSPFQSFVTGVRGLRPC